MSTKPNHGKNLTAGQLAVVPPARRTGTKKRKGESPDMAITNQFIVPDRTAPVGLLRAAGRGDRTAMLALADFFRERGLPPGAGDGEPEPGDEEVALGFRQLALECEQAALQLHQIDDLLNWHGTPAPQGPALRARERVSGTAARIEGYLAGLGIPLPVSAGGFTRTLPVSQWDRRAYTVWLPWTGEDSRALTERLIHYLSGAYPGVRFVTTTRSGDWLGAAGTAAAMLGWG